jgi:hypothetical protein
MLRDTVEEDIEMKRLVRYSLEGGGDIVVEVDEPEASQEGVERAARQPWEKIQDAGQTLDDALDRTIRPAALAIVRKLTDLGEQHSPQEIGVEFGVKLGGKLGGILASASAEATYKVSLKWQRPQAAK